jgi:hypothetical protein
MMATEFTWARFRKGGYEVSTAGDKRFSALNARLWDGRTIEEAYQLDVKGYREEGNDWRIGKGRPPLHGVDLWKEYLELWRTWAYENPELIQRLREATVNFVLTDKFSTTGISQARALATILNETPSP